MHIHSKRPKHFTSDENLVRAEGNIELCHALLFHFTGHIVNAQMTGKQSAVLIVWVLFLLSHYSNHVFSRCIIETEWMGQLVKQN